LLSVTPTVTVAAAAVVDAVAVAVAGVVAPPPSSLSSSPLLPSPLPSLSCCHHCHQNFRRRSLRCCF
jgi:hypothetical protein